MTIANGEARIAEAWFARSALHLALGGRASIAHQRFQLAGGVAMQRRWAMVSGRSRSRACSTILASPSAPTLDGARATAMSCPTEPSHQWGPEGERPGGTVSFAANETATRPRATRPTNRLQIALISGETPRRAWL